MSRLIAFWSPSGAGASTLLLNTAAALGARRSDVVAADLNLTRPSLALLTDLLPHDRPLQVCLSRLLPALEGDRLTGAELYQCLLQSPGFLLAPGFIDVVAASQIQAEHVRHLLHLLGKRSAYLLADVTPALDSVACVPILERADLIYLVLGPDLPSRFHARRNAIPLLGTALEKKTRLVLNRSGKALDDELALEIGLPVSATVPLLGIMPTLVEAGQLAYRTQPLLPAQFRFRAAIDKLAAQIMVLGGVQGGRSETASL